MGDGLLVSSSDGMVVWYPLVDGDVETVAHRAWKAQLIGGIRSAVNHRPGENTRLLTYQLEILLC